MDNLCLSAPFLRTQRNKIHRKRGRQLSPAGGGQRGWKRNTKPMREKPNADETNNYAYNKWLRPFSNNLRKKMKKAEACLWKYPPPVPLWRGIKGEE